MSYKLSDCFIKGDKNMRYSKETVLMVVLFSVVVASGFDLYVDLSHGAPFSHIAKEAVILALASVTVIWILLEQAQQKRQISQLKQELASIDKNHEAMSDYIQTMRKQLSEVISKQFNDWQLTASEKEIAWLLLKGLSLKEIAVLRDTLEKTVRQQASSTYKKAGVSGRHAFAAWFIEDLF